MLYALFVLNGVIRVGSSVDIIYYYTTFIVIRFIEDKNGFPGNNTISNTPTPHIHESTNTTHTIILMYNKPTQMADANRCT